jgi:hypothetical protein
MDADYPTRLQGIRRKSGQVQIYANIPLPLAAALDLEIGEQVRWKVMDRRRLVLVRAPGKKKIEGVELGGKKAAVEKTKP